MIVQHQVNVEGNATYVNVGAGSLGRTGVLKNYVICGDALQRQSWCFPDAARGYASAADVACCAGMLVDAELCIGHARLARRREWVLHLKRLLGPWGLTDTQHGCTAAELSATVTAVGRVLGVHRQNAR